MLMQLENFKYIFLEYMIFESKFPKISKDKIGKQYCKCLVKKCNLVLRHFFGNFITTPLYLHSIQCIQKPSK